MVPATVFDDRAGVRGWSLGRHPAAQGTAFQAVALAGRGEFADVWKVRESASGCLYALKQLRPEWEPHAAARRLLENEAEVGRIVRGPHVVRVVDAHLKASPRFVLLEWLAGETLERRMERSGPLPCHQALWIARQCAAGLAALESAGLIHGDVKPSNVFVCDKGTVKLIDLGFARPIGAARGDLTGTPDYLAPEVLAGVCSNSSRDVYSLGVVCFRMLTGKLPFAGVETVDLLRQHQGTKSPSIRHTSPEVPTEVARFVQRLLSKQPLRRCGTLRDLVQEFVSLEVQALAAEAASSSQDMIVDRVP